MTTVNLVRKIFKLKKPFVFFHTHVLDRKIMDSVIANKKNVEIDISMTPQGEIYVGHPLTYYSSRGLPPPNNLPLDQIVDEAKSEGIFLVFDCKNIHVLPKVEELIKKIGPENCLIHAFVQELEFKPYPPKFAAMEEESWPEETLPLEEVFAVKKSSQAPLVLSCHGITRDRIASDPGLIDKVIKTVKSKAEIANIFLPKDETMPLAVSNQILQAGILPLVSADRTPINYRPPFYFGSTDNLDLASDPRDFLA